MIKSTIYYLWIAVLVGLILVLLSKSLSCQTKSFFIGDYGENTTGELMVKNTMLNWMSEKDTLFTLGDNNYPNGEATTIMENVGKYYSEFMYPFNTSGFSNPNRYKGSSNLINYFFACFGNHDWYSNPTYSYLLFFGHNIPNTSSGNDRYYYVTQGKLVLFVVVDSWVGDNPPSWVRPEPDGISATSVQAMWVKSILQNSSAKWKIVIMHHPPYCSTLSTYIMRWPYKQWGVDLVMAGHDHLYERLYIDSLYYTINGCGGAAMDPLLPTPIQGSQKLYNSNFGFQMLTAYPDSLNCKFINVSNIVVDNFTILKGYNPPPIETDTLTISDSVKILWDREFNK